MLEDFQYQGSWWLPEYPENKVSGILRFIHNQKIILELIGCFPVNHSSIILGNALNNKGGTQEKITLYGVSFKSQDGHPNFNDVVKSLFKADFLLIGEHFSKSDDIQFYSLSASFTYLEEWLGNLPFETEYEDNITIKYRYPEKYKIQLDSLASELFTNHSFNDESDNFRKVTIYNTSFLEIIPKEQKKLEWFTQVIRDLQNFLALVTNLRVYPKSLRAFSTEKQVPFIQTEEGEIQYKNRRTPIQIYYILPNYFALEDSLPVTFHILFHFPQLKDKLESYIDNWFKNAEKLRPIYDLYFSTFYDVSINPLIQFLSLAQAIEVYHREVVGGKYISDESYEIIKNTLYEAIPKTIPELNQNSELLRSFKDSLKSRIKYGYQYSLRKRLKDLVDQFWEGCLENFIENKNKFGEGIADLRNYLTHYDKKDFDNARMKFGVQQADVSDLCNFLNPRIRLLLIILLLDQVGIERNALYEVINKYREFEPLKPSFWKNRSTRDKEIAHPPQLPCITVATNVLDWESKNPVIEREHTMRLSKMLFVTLREDPAEAEIPSHKLLLRAGYIRRIGSGIYAYLPLMWRVLQKVSQIVREEMNATGAQECLLPQLQPSELWKESGRWDTYTKAEGIMFAFQDRQEREVALGPTHEEVITTIARDMIRSYRQLPLHLYQIQTKFRDEIRPRFGLMRGREFIMKDGYSFHTDEESLKKTYQDMYQAYSNMLRRAGLKFRPVEADSGAIGGSGSTEFMILADAGEDEVLYTEDGQYSANVEKAVSLPPDAEPSPFTAYEKRETPNTPTIDSLSEFLKCSPTQIVKNVLYQAIYDNGMTVLVLVSIRGDQDVNEVKLNNELVRQAEQYNAKTLLSLIVPDAAAQQKWASKPLPLGYIAPDIADDYINSTPLVKGGQGGIAPQFLRLVDKTVVDLKNFVTGSNESGYHVVGANWGDQFQLPKLEVDVRKAKIGDRAIHNSSQTLQSARGIEAGHIFQLGTKYSKAMGATYTSESGEEIPLYMGCYGVGVSRLAQAAVEQSYDKDGIIWPVAIAPYHAIICVPNVGDAAQMEAAEKLYTELNAAGIETLLDDRNERAGVKFKDADLIGIPYRIVTGRSLKDGKLEVVQRATKQSQDIPIDEVVPTLKKWIEEAVKG